ncbi:hypothetical protein [Paraburkholderia terrae]
MDARVRRQDHPMPELAAFVQALGDAFGDAEIDDAVQRGRTGEPTFYACENGRSVGIASPSGLVWRVDDAIHDRHFCAGCNGRCVGTDARCIER